MKNQDKLPVDLTLKDFFIIFICMFSMFIFGFGFNVIL
jgi:hypothetical protein